MFNFYDNKGKLVGVVDAAGTKSATRMVRESLGIDKPTLVKIPEELTLNHFKEFFDKLAEELKDYNSQFTEYYDYENSTKDYTAFGGRILILETGVEDKTVEVVYLPFEYVTKNKKKLFEFSASIMQKVEDGSNSIDDILIPVWNPIIAADEIKKLLARAKD